MSIVNRRNAAIGWLAWRVGKSLVSYRATGGRGGGGSKGRTALKVGALAAAVGGAVVFWKVKHRDSTDHDSIASEDLGTVTFEEPGTPTE